MANNPTASKQYVLPLSFVSGDITSGSFTDGGTIIHYLKIGNLYFGFWRGQGAGAFVNTGLGAAYPLGTQITDTVARLATQLGITVNTTYLGYMYGAAGQPRLGYWNGAAWADANANEGEFIQAILAN